MAVCLSRFPPTKVGNVHDLGRCTVKKGLLLEHILAQLLPLLTLV